MFPSEVFSWSTRDVGIMDWNFKSFTCGKADGETVAWEGLWMATDLISVFLRVEPLAISLHICASRFRFLLWHYAILMSNSFTLVHFCTLAQPLHCLLFCFSLKTNLYNDLFLRTRLWKQRQQSIVSWRTASPHCSMQRLWLDVFLQIDGQFTCENFHAKKKKKIIVHTNNSQNNSSLSLLILYFRPHRSLP